uniref:Denticleless protein homolog isoform X3 n=1 Tax=Cicer arietinum TaxID=3827 RepID=A0A3Q7XLF7_CICAR|nr:denticleless protein homolog isoform X3 [Cicer arietinum]
MKFREPKSIFNHIASRELNSFHVQKRPKMDKLLSVYNEIEAIHIFNDEFDFIPFAISFSKTSKRCYDIAVADEHGYVTLFDTRRNKTKKICEWIAHQVSSTVFFTEVYDLCWIKEDTQILTASGDKTVKVWDLQQKDCLGALRGHTDFVQSICSHPTNHDIIVSGSRDKSFRLWDLRCKSNAESGDGEISISSTAVVKRAHLYYDEEDRQVDSMGIRSVLWLKDQVSIATAGSKDSVPKFWDTRYLKQDVTYTGLLPRSTEKQRLHGLTSLSQDDHGVFLLASCKDNRIYLYNILQNKKEPLRYFEGDRISFSGKAAISPDALNIGCCSREGKVYIWQVLHRVWKICNFW